MNKLFYTTAFYLKLHTELTLLAFFQIHHLEDAEDMASECLLQYCQQETKSESIVSLKAFLQERLFELCRLWFKNKQRVKLAEAFYSSQLSGSSATVYSYMEALRCQLLDIIGCLSPEEQLVVTHNLINGTGLPEIANEIQRPLSSVRIILDRAIFYLKKYQEQRKTTL